MKPTRRNVKPAKKVFTDVLGEKQRHVFFRKMSVTPGAFLLVRKREKKMTVFVTRS